MDKLLDDYVDLFGENFPLRALMGEEEEEVMRIITNCIKTKKAYNPQYKDKAIY